MRMSSLSCSRLLAASSFRADGLEADRRLASSLRTISQSRMAEALKAFDPLTPKDPNFRLMQRIRSDLPNLDGSRRDTLVSFAQDCLSNALSDHTPKGRFRSREDGHWKTIHETSL
jgi:hypothetical protein